MPSINTRQALLADLEAVVPLFDAYRQFYGKVSDVDNARRFLRERFEHGQSTLFIAEDSEGRAVGFTQLYPSFSSAAMARIYVLNALFVAPAARKQGVGEALLRAAADHARALGAVRLSLSTALTNSTAQALYERTGWQRDQVFCAYTLALPA
ncbi:MAG: GNAT family N-acetyltransferase [Rubrivivax sp.]|nr:MAG: GNAT family N-acetyltransferase [Rubrivivax sp.]